MPGMDLLNFKNLFNFSGIVSNVLYVILIIAGAILLIGGMWVYSKYFRKKKDPNLKQIGWWEEVHGDMVPLSIDDASEITIPGTNLKIFYVKKKDLWLPRFTRGITKDLFYVCITQDREIVNFTLKSLAKDRAEADLNYDHTDMRWAAENTKEFIKRNYRDKATKWWKEYKEAIVLIAYIVILTVSFCAIGWMLLKVVDRVGILIDHADQLIQAAKQFSQSSTSGIVPAGS